MTPKTMTEEKSAAVRAQIMDECLPEEITRMFTPAEEPREATRILMAEKILPEKITAIPTPEAEPSVVVRRNLSHRGGGAKATALLTIYDEPDAEVRAGVVQNCAASVIKSIPAAKKEPHAQNRRFAAKRISAALLTKPLTHADDEDRGVRWQAAQRIPESVLITLASQKIVLTESAEPDAGIRQLVTRRTELAKKALLEEKTVEVFEEVKL